MSKNEALEKAWKNIRNEYHPVIVEVMKEALTTAQEVQERSRQTAIRDRIIEGLDERISPEGLLAGVFPGQNTQLICRGFREVQSVVGGFQRA